MGLLFSKCDDLEKARLARSPTCDIFRDSPLRMLGYAAHLGVCSNVLPPKAILTGQMITTAYVLGDVFQKSAYSAKKLDSDGQVIKNSLDALLWQLLATVIIPGFILSKTRTLTRTLIRKTSSGTCGPNSKTLNWLPCIASLILAPFIMKPIDNCVDYIMDNTFRDSPKTDANITLGEKARNIKKDIEGSSIF